MSEVGTKSQQKSITAVVNFDRNAIFFSLVYKLTRKIRKWSGRRGESGISNAARDKKMLGLGYSKNDSGEIPTFGEQHLAAFGYTFSA